MVAAGAVTVLVACRYLASRAPGILAAMAVTGVAGVGLKSATNFMLHSDYRWLLLVPSLLWLAGLVCYLREGTQ